MKNKILGWIGVIWGGLILVNSILDAVSGNSYGGAYGVGRAVGTIFGGLLVFAGVRALRAAQDDALDAEADED